MPNKIGSWDDIRLAVWTVVPAIMLLFIGGINIHTRLGDWSLWIGISISVASVILAFIDTFNKRTGCEGCRYNTDHKFLRQFENVAKKKDVEELIPIVIKEVVSAVIKEVIPVIVNEVTPDIIEKVILATLKKTIPEVISKTKKK